MPFFRKYFFLKNPGLVALFLIFLGSNSARECESRMSPSLSSSQLDFEEYSILSPSLIASVEKNSDDKKDLEEQLKLLLDELKQLGKEGEEKFKKDILPYIRREIEKLRNRLREFHPDEEEPSQPQRIQV